MGRFRSVPSDINRRGDETPRASIGRLRGILPYLRPYRVQIVVALIALTVGAASVLVLGVGLRMLVDQGFRAGNIGLLNQALTWLIVIVAVLASATFARFYLVSWIGERIVADLRRDVFDHVLRLSPAFFETTRIGEIISRLTTDNDFIVSFHFLYWLIL